MSRFTVRRSALLLGLSFALAARSAGQDTEADLLRYEKTLKDANIGTDVDALLHFFRSRTLSDKEKIRLREFVPQLGDRSFAVRDRAERELLTRGRAILPLLRPAMNNKDLEIARRVQRYIDELENGEEATLAVAAGRLLVAKKVAGAAEVILRYVPVVGDDHTLESLQSSVAELGLRDGKVDRAVVAALGDPEPQCRAVAAYTVGLADARQRGALKPLLGDADPRVRLKAATALVRGGDAEAVSALMGLLADSPLSLASQAEDVLYQLAGEKAPSTALTGDDDGRKKCRVAWEDWWKTNAAKVDWKRLQVEQPLLGLTLVCEAHLADGGKVWEIGSDRKRRWEVKVGNPIDAQVLPGDRILVADCHGGRVVEFDRQGKEHWTYKCDSPISVQRLANGNTFVGCYGRVCEVTREGKELYSYARTTGSCYYARKLRNGHIVCVHGNGTFVELDASGKEVVNLNVGGMGNWAGVEALPNGRYLVAKAGANEVVEIDTTGKVYWNVSVRNPNSAVRLRNGHTLVASHDDKAVYEFDRAGKEVWKQTMDGNPFRVRRR